MTARARRSGLETLRGVLRRRHLGFDAIFAELEGHDRAADSGAGEIGRGVAPPKDSDSGAHRIGVAATASCPTNHDRVDEPAEHLSAIIDGEG